jgi:hypothetical protein
MKIIVVTGPQGSWSFVLCLHRCKLLLFNCTSMYIAHSMERDVSPWFYACIVVGCSRERNQSGEEMISLCLVMIRNQANELM